MIQTLHQMWDRARLRPLERPHLRLSRVILFGALFGVVLGAILAVPLNQAALIAKNLPSPITYEAPHDLIYTSDVMTQAAQQQAAQDSSNVVYHTDTSILVTQRASLVSTLNSITAIRNDPTLDQAKRIATITVITTVALTPKQAQAILQLPKDSWERVVDQTRQTYDQMLRDHNNTFTDQDIENVRTRVLPYQMVPPDFSPAQQSLMITFTSAFLRANSTIDQAATDQNRASARARVEPVKRTIARGQNIVRRGDIVTDETFEALSRFGVVRGAGGLISTIQQFGLGVLVAGIFTLYLSICQRPIFSNRRALLVIGALLCVIVLLARVLLPSWHSTPYMFPFAVVGVLLAVIFNSDIALLATLLFAPLVGLQSESALGLTLALALGSAAGIFTAHRAQRTSTFAWTGLSVAVVTMLAGLIFWVDTASDMQWIESNPLLNATLIIVVFSLINGALSAVLALGSSHFLSRAANVVTPLQLMELAHPNQPLLRRLMHDAPGTYHHSMVVSNLAELAAESIDADPLLTRVGAYYHDVGKLLRPFFFTDNQHDRSNVHDQLDAKTSASVIIDHVREGTKLAQSYGLPQQIVDFIPQHHGTNVVSYFYQRALQEDADADIKAFCYPGPRPQTREAAILMLADGVEATVRARSQAGKLAPARPEGDDQPRHRDTIEATVDQIVNERIAAHQLDESPLTLHDLALIKESFIHTLHGIYHPRVDYAEQRKPG
ncbi:MAG: HDIG domain-containing protein [Herpetosiphonaceae bacterium]|nr:HDIG domain-containing protein [Herpetosiphonaceae bacterium]